MYLLVLTMNVQKALKTYTTDDQPFKVEVEKMGIRCSILDYGDELLV